MEAGAAKRPIRPWQQDTDQQPQSRQRGVFGGWHAPPRAWAPRAPRAHLAGNDEQGSARKVARHNGVAAVGRG